MSDKIKDGGPAFPRVEIKTLGNGDLKSVDHPGLSLRDYFAAKAMQSFIIIEQDNYIAGKIIPNAAYNTADAMLKERNKDELEEDNDR